MAKFSEHSFWCINCGQRGLPVQRRVSHNHSKHHRKKLWCPNCKMEINHVECRNDDEIYEFKENFKNGVYIDEAKESMDTLRGSGVR